MDSCGGSLVTARSLLTAMPRQKKKSAGKWSGDAAHGHLSSAEDGLFRMPEVRPYLRVCVRVYLCVYACVKV